MEAAHSKMSERATSDGAPIRGLFLDMYGTLTGGDRAAVEAVCEQVVRAHPLPTSARALSIEWGELFFAAIESANGPAFHTLFDLEQITLVETLARYDVTLDPRPYAEALREYWRDPPLHDEVLDGLSMLRIPVCIVSNADRDDVAAALARHGLSDLAFVTSECARSYKPDRGVFDLALRRTGWDPDTVIHVGDSLHSDVGGARAAGLRAGWLCREGRIHDVGEKDPDHTFRDLRELAAWVNAHAIK
ncbi:MAG: HAD family hydrolase [Phycisphaerae bacterium]|nr:HAD family hydrolase [Phycisphaerae bacterium]